MGCDVFIEYTCPYREHGGFGRLQTMFHHAVWLDTLRRSPTPDGPLRVIVDGPEGSHEVTCAAAELEASAAALEEVVRACQDCPANFMKALGEATSVGCWARVNFPVDGFCEQILYEALCENARPERFFTAEGDLVRQIGADGRPTGRTMETLAREYVAAGALAASGELGARPVGFPGGEARSVTVYQLEEYLLFRPQVPADEVPAVAAFFAVLFDVVGRYVSTAGRLDAQKNLRFWSRSASLRELNLLAAAAAHAGRLGAGLGLGES